MADFVDEIADKLKKAIETIPDKPRDCFFLCGRKSRWGIARETVRLELCADCSEVVFSALADRLQGNRSMRFLIRDVSKEQS